MPNRKSQHFHITYSIRNVEYRQQALLLTPLGSSYDDVAAFARKEWHFEKHQPGRNALFQHPLVDRHLRFCFWFGHGAGKEFVEQTPHIHLPSPNTPFTTQQGKFFVYPGFYSRPLWWKRELYVAVVYVFDDQSKLVDIFARGDEVRPPSM